MAKALSETDPSEFPDESLDRSGTVELAADDGVSKAEELEDESITGWGTYSDPVFEEELELEPEALFWFSGFKLERPTLVNSPGLEAGP